MTTEELGAMIETRVDGAVATALKRIKERQDDLQPRAVPERIVVEGTDGEARNARTLVMERRGIALGGAIAYLGMCKMDLDRARQLAAKDKWAEEAGVLKTLNAGEATAGGVLITPEFSQEIIDLLAPRTVVRRHVSNIVDLSSGVLNMPRMSADASMSWGGEVDQISSSEPALDEIVLRPFQGKILVPISNTLLKRGGPRVAAMIRNSMLRSWALGEDLVFITSPGTEHRPKGMRYWTALANQLTAQAFTGTASQKLQIVTDDLGRLILRLEESNVPMTSPVWFMAPRTRQYLLTARDGNGNTAFPEVKGGMLYGWPIETTTQIVRNEGVGADESLVYLADADELMIGQGQSLEISLSSEGTYVDVDSSVVSAFQRNMSLLRLINETGFAPQHAESIGFLSAVKWAPSSS